MKTLVTLLFFASCWMSGHAQNATPKHQFGSLAKAGTFLAATHTVKKNDYLEGSYGLQESISRPGSVTTFGMFYKWNFSRAWSLQTELMWRTAFLSNEEKSSYFYLGELVSSSKQMEQLKETSLSLPLKIQVQPLSRFPVFLFAGIGVSRALRSDIKLSSLSIYPGSPEAFTVLPIYRVPFKVSDFNMSYTMGLQYRIKNGLYLGVEYTMESHQRNNNLPIYFEYPSSNNLIECLCYGFVFNPTRPVRSLTFGIWHNFNEKTAE